MQTAVQTNIRRAAAPLVLQRCCLVGGNPAAQILPADGLPALEAMLPQIRTVAMMIAATRHDFGKRSPQTFADEADWFAARIIVLRVHAFHIGLGLRPTLETANRRAAAFAAEHNLPFAPARAVLSMRPRRSGFLIADCALPCDGRDRGLIENSRRLAAQIRPVFQTIV